MGSRGTPDWIPDHDLAALAAWCLFQAMIRQDIELRPCDNCHLPWLGTASGSPFCGRPAPHRFSSCRELMKQARFRRDTRSVPRRIQAPPRGQAAGNCPTTSGPVGDGDKPRTPGSCSSTGSWPVGPRRHPNIAANGLPPSRIHDPRGTEHHALRGVTKPHHTDERAVVGGN